MSENLSAVVSTFKTCHIRKTSPCFHSSPVLYVLGELLIAHQWALQDSTSLVPMWTTRGRALSRPGSLELPLSVGRGTAGSGPSGRGAGRTTVRAMRHRARIVAGGGSLVSVRTAQTQTTLPPAAGSTGTRARPPGRPHSRATETQSAGSSSYSPRPGAAVWSLPQEMWPPCRLSERRWEARNSCRRRLPGRLRASGGPAKRHWLQPVDWGGGERERGSDGGRRRPGTWRIQRKYMSNPNKSSGTSWRTTT